MLTELSMFSLGKDCESQCLESGIFCSLAVQFGVKRRGIFPFFVSQAYEQVRHRRIDE